MTDIIALLEQACGGRCNAENNPCEYKEAALELQGLKPVAYIDHVSGKPKLIDGYVVQTDYDIPLYTKEQA